MPVTVKAAKPHQARRHHSLQGVICRVFSVGKTPPAVAM
jgi:hypothetical protein